MADATRSADRGEGSTGGPAPHRADAGHRRGVVDTGWMRVAGAHVLLTGATGDIGRRLAVRLAEAGADVTVVAAQP